MTTMIKQKSEDGFIPRTGVGTERVARMRVEEAGLRPPKDDADTFAIRMNGDGIKYELWRLLAGMIVIKDSVDGQYYLQRIKYMEPMMSLEGATKLITLISSILNPSVVLAKTKEEEAFTLWRQLHEGVSRALGIDKDSYGVSDVDRENIMNAIGTLSFHQLTRAIGGHESSNLITHIEEQRGEHSVTQNQGKKRGWFGGAKQ